jgi:hypothetical protein
VELAILALYLTPSRELKCAKGLVYCWSHRPIFSEPILRCIVSYFIKPSKNVPTQLGYRLYHQVSQSIYLHTAYGKIGTDGDKVLNFSAFTSFLTKIQMYNFSTEVESAF